MKLNKTERETLKQKYNGHCAYCGDVLGEKWHADHIIPIKRDMKDYAPHLDCWENLNPACPPCNHNKKSMTLEAWRKTLHHYRDVQVVRDCSQVRHLLRFNMIEFKTSPVVFYFEEFENERA